MDSRSIPQISLALLDTDRDELLAQLKHALVEFGAFTINAYDDLFDDNIVALVEDQASQFFDLPFSSKLQISMDKSEGFLGYTSETTQQSIVVSESVHFASTDIDRKKAEPYGYLRVANQFPSKGPPLFKKSIDDYLSSMTRFSNTLFDLIIESLDLSKSEAATFSTSNSNYYNRAAVIANHPFNSAECTSHPQSYSNKKDATLFTLHLNNQTKNPIMQFQDIFGEWLDVPHKSSQIVVSVGKTLEYITQGVCLSGSYRYLAPSQDTQLIVPFYHHANLKAIPSILTISPRLLTIMKHRDQLRSKALRTNFKPESPMAKMILHELIKTDRTVASIHHSATLKTIQDSETSEAVINATNPKSKTRSASFIRLSKVFRALDSIVFMNVRTRVADIKLHTLLPQVHRFSEYNAQLKDLLQVCFIWPEFAVLKVDDDGDVVVDSEATKDVLNFKEVGVRANVFDTKMRKWLDDHVGVEVPTISPDQLTLKSSGGEVTKKRGRVEILQKTSKKKKSDALGSGKGLSLLERIKRKEQENLKNHVSPEERYAMYLDSKVGQVLDIVATMRPDKPHSIEALTEQVRNSLNTKNALGKNEARDLVYHLQKKFPEVFKVYTGKDVSVLRWKDFDANELKKKC